LFPGKVEWRNNYTIRITNPANIISNSKIEFILTGKDFVLRDGRAFISIRKLVNLLKASEIIWISETKSIRIV